MRILVVEDEKKIANFIKRGLKEEGYAVDTSGNGNDGLKLAMTESYDLVILDIMLPGMDGLSVCKKIREAKIKTPVIMLTAKDKTEDKVMGLDCGADDYLTKPFAFEEFLARVRAHLRRKEKGETTKLKTADLEIDLLARSVKRGNKEIMLTAKEFSLLEYLMQNSKTVVTRTMISEHVWDINFDTFTNVIDVYIRHLREKVDKAPFKKLIHTIRGRGYVLKE